MELVRERARQQYLQWVVEDPTRAKMYAEQKTSGRERQKQKRKLEQQMATTTTRRTHNNPAHPHKLYQQAQTNKLSQD